MKSAMRAARMKRAAGEGFALEAMEGRQLLAADLAVAWDTTNFHIPAVLVPGDRFDPAGGSNRIEAPIQVVDVGTTFATGNVRIDFYLSLDTTLNTSVDILMRSYPSELVSLDVYTGDPNQIGIFSPDMYIPADTAPGSYFLIVRLVPAGNIGDFNTSNNTAASDDPIVVDRKFGSFNGRTNVVMALKDPEGTVVTFSATGGGYGTVTPSAGAFGVTLNGTGNFTAVSIAAGGGDGAYDLNFVTINGSVGSFAAPAGRLIGAMTATTGMGAMTLGDVLGPLTITVPGTSQNVSFTFGDVKELTLTSAVGINTLSVRSWDDRAGAADSINAPWIGALNSTNNFYPSIHLSGRGGGMPTLGPVNITGVVKTGAWSINGSGSTIFIFAMTVNFSASYHGAITSLTMTGSFRGVLTASSIGSINVGKDILRGKILAGAYLGDDGLLGGSASNADTYGAGTIGTIDVFRNIAGNIIGAGLDPVDGVFQNHNDRIDGGTTSSIGQITVGHIVGAVSRLLTNVYTGAISIGGAAVDWRVNSRFVLSTAGPAANLSSADVSDMGGVQTAGIAISFVSTGLINLGSITGAAIRVDGPGGFSALCTLVISATDNNGRDGLGVFKVALAAMGDPAPVGTYTIFVVANTVKDDRGNFSPGVSIGTFMV